MRVEDLNTDLLNAVNDVLRKYDVKTINSHICGFELSVNVGELPQLKEFKALFPGEDNEQ